MNDQIKENVNVNNSIKIGNDNINNTMNYNYKEKIKENKKNINTFYKAYFAKEAKKDKNNKNNKNNSVIISYDNNKNDLLEINNKYKYKINNENVDNSNYIKMNKSKQFYSTNCSAERCQKCKCYIDNNNVFEKNTNRNDLEYYYKNNDIYNKIKNNNYNKNNNKHSSLPKNKNKNSNILKLNYNTSTNTKSYYLEDSYKNNNLIINKLKKNDNYNGNIHFNKKESNNINKFSSFYNLLNDFINQDNKIQSIRRSLSIQEDFNLTDLFELFDQSSKKLISSMDFLETLKKFGLFFTYEDITYIFRKFNKKIDEYFEYEEFCEIFLPKQCSNTKIMNEKEENKDYYEITEETKNIICLLFKNIIDGEKSNENYRKKLNENSGFDLFNKIKKHYSIGIYKEDLSNFMKKNKNILSNDEIELLMERFDKNKDGMIDYKEFLNAITPMNN